MTDIGAEGFRRVRSRQGLRITGGDERGAMYGVLDVAEQIRMGTPWNKIQERTVKAQLEFRAIKFNLPWSAYRTSPALEQHQETCKDLKFWEAFLDMMAENRFNVLSLWSLHPYTYMIRPKNFPEACPFNDAELAEWKKLWSGIFAMAKERGIETYLLNWNIFVSPEFSRAHNVAPWSVSLSHIGKEADATGELVVRYTREVVTQVLDEYPDLTGLGITLGERMGGMTPDQRRDWLDQTFFAGIAEAKRPAKFIYRAPLSANTGSGGTTSEENDRRTRAQIESLTNNITGPVYVEFKHNWSHAHSSPDLFIVHGGPLSDAYWNPPPTRHKVVWTMRNEDMLHPALGAAGLCAGVHPTAGRQGLRRRRNHRLGVLHPGAGLHHEGRPAQDLALGFPASMALLRGVGTTALRSRHTGRAIRGDARRAVRQRHGEGPARRVETGQPRPAALRIVSSGHVGWLALHGRFFVLDRSG